jgi:hypothetical protein
MTSRGQVVFGTVILVGIILFLIGMGSIFSKGPFYNWPDPVFLFILIVCAGLGVTLAFGGFLGYLAYSARTPEYRERVAREENLRVQADLDNARNLETAGRFEEAAAIYERYNMFGDAGRARSGKREMKVSGGVGTGQTQVIREKETIVKEVVMIPCNYCGGLMPQTATFCPNCGATRKRS